MGNLPSGIFQVVRKPRGTPSHGSSSPVRWGVTDAGQQAKRRFPAAPPHLRAYAHA